MNAPQKLAFVVQGNRLQGLIWQALLKSQKLAVILEPANTDLGDCISQIAAAGLTLPDVIVLDAEATGLNPYEFSRWCRNTYPQIQVFLTRCRQPHISDTERRWAQQQGISDFLPGFERDMLMTSAAANVKRILTELDYPFFNERALLTVLLNVRRQLGTIQATGDSGAASVAKGANVPGLKLAKSATPPQAEPARAVNGTAPDPLNDLEWVAAGLRSLAKKGLGQTAPPPKAPPTPKVDSLPSPKDERPAGEATVRRYRGVVY